MLVYFMKSKSIILLIMFTSISTLFNFSDNKTLFDVDPSYQMKSEIRLFELINAERVKIGLPKLIINTKLNEVALKHSIKMAEQNNLSHILRKYKSLTERYVDGGLFFNSTGENVAFSSTVDPEIIHKGFMESPSHKENILSRSFSHVGIKMYNSENGIYTTQEFSHLFRPLENSWVKNYLIEQIQNYTKNEWGQLPIVLENIDKDLSYNADYTYERFNITSPDLDELLLYVYRYLKYSRIISFSANVSFTRNKKFRGGAYSISCAFHKTGFFDGLTEKKVETILFKRINSLRKNKGKESFIISHKKYKIAKKNIADYYRNKIKNLKFEFDNNVIIYVTKRPMVLSEEYKSMDFFLVEKETIGICVYYPDLHGETGNHCIISIYI